MAAAFCIVYNNQTIKLRKAFQRMRAHASNRYCRNFGGLDLADRENLSRLARTLYNTNLASLNAGNNLEAAFSSVLDQAIIYLQHTIAPEQLDVILVSLMNTNQRHAKAFVFKNNMDSASHQSI
jgi:hypothetical protein